MRVNIAVPGKFHYFNYLEFIAKAGVLSEFYYSHKLNGTLPEGVHSQHAHNCFLKEYLTFFHLKFMRGLQFNRAVTFYQDLWENEVLKKWADCEIFHLLNHGAARRLCRRAKQAGSIVVGEPVNSHPANMFKILTDEHERLGIPYYREMPATFSRMIEEAESFDYVLSPSQFVTKSYAARGFDASRIFTLPFGVDLNAFESRNQEKKKFRVIYVAQITPRKGHIDLLNAWSMMKLPTLEAELIFVGHIDPVMKPILKKFEGTYTYAGTVPRSRLVELYNASSVFVMPSLEEGCSYAPLEAMACGLPVILTENTGSGELVDHGKEGFIIPIRRPDLIADYLTQLYDHAGMRTAMALAAVHRAKEGFGWNSYAVHILSMYNKIMRK
ncbi:MAG TPA: glycosyltransferase family 4 protein [Cyclobacteriaceae bacterium]|nr:glycosyltransferase family 4 protein [Cyclobacteriaceae bacterium]